MKLTKEMCEEHFAALPIDFQRWIVAVTVEYDSAVKQHPEWPEDLIHKAAIVAEESGELIQAALQYQYEKGRYYQMHKEATQTAAMCFRFLLNTPELPFNHD
ncbi:MAG: hypothetical protein JNM22_01965 [Saprospiraceae bacterium]|nr:hypothetical protein [Saprospiraceae bacterium]